jgi:hypothetical protein
MQKCACQCPDFDIVKFEGHMALVCHNVVYFLHSNNGILFCQATMKRGHANPA